MVAANLWTAAANVELMRLHECPAQHSACKFVYDTARHDSAHITPPTSALVLCRAMQRAKTTLATILLGSAA